MFSLFKKKSKKSSLYSPCSGSFLTIDKVNDQVFAEKMMGDGYAITPESGIAKIYSPVKGKILSIFPTKHAITFLNDEGLEVLIHMGIDTVSLNGKGFDIKVKSEDQIDQTTLLAEMNVDFITDQGKGIDVIVVITNLGDNKKLILNAQGKITATQSVGEVQFL